MKAASVFLRTDISASDVLSLSSWLGNRNITRYLNESDGVTVELTRIAESVPPHLMTYHLNRGGRFFMICGEAGAVGFVRLQSAGPSKYEIVFVIGEEKIWGCGYGAAAVAKALDSAFLDLRAASVTARIYADNVRSVHVVKRCGFSLESRGEKLDTYSISFRDYMSRRLGHV